MPTITVVPHPEYASEGAAFGAAAGGSICDALLENGIEIEHACGKVGACSTCHVVIQAGFASLRPSRESEEDMLDRAWGLEPSSRLSCQAIVSTEDLVVEIPKYSVNHARENT
ncbi:ISC system 2Fe-2S type ferredoxin [Noviherbaspirillum sp.]|uniref:ISC system 2Fe-2S type ferredoxin n=1 Tax=Noviherbaspirillum sp. TaxID=1926288 RepID=UPI002FE0486C